MMSSTVKKIALTGAPGVGKTTICEQLVDEIPGAGGIITAEQRDERGLRNGFILRDVYSGNTGTLAHTDINSGPKVGKYGIDVKESEAVMVPALEYALESAKWIILDEVGPMELKLNSFLPLARRVLKCNKPVILTYQQKLWGGIVEEIKRMCQVEVITNENRDEMAEHLKNSLGPLVRDAG